MSIVKKDADDCRAKFWVKCSNRTVHISSSPISPIVNDNPERFAKAGAAVKPLPSPVNRQGVPKKLMNAKKQRFGADLHADNLKKLGERKRVIVTAKIDRVKSDLAETDIVKNRAGE